jgi:hypothetical protein
MRIDGMHMLALLDYLGTLTRAGNRRLAAAAGSKRRRPVRLRTDKTG